MIKYFLILFFYSGFSFAGDTLASTFALDISWHDVKLGLLALFGSLLILAILSYSFILLFRELGWLKQTDAVLEKRRKQEASVRATNDWIKESMRARRQDGNAMWISGYFRPSSRN